jgi:hypothetical protein
MRFCAAFHKEHSGLAPDWTATDRDLNTITRHRSLTKISMQYGI